MNYDQMDKWTSVLIIILLTLAGCIAFGTVVLAIVIIQFLMGGG